MEQKIEKFAKKKNKFLFINFEEDKYIPEVCVYIYVGEISVPEKTFFFFKVVVLFSCRTVIKQIINVIAT